MNTICGVINVEVVDFSIHSVLAELAQCMRSFSNLHTVRLRISVRSLTGMAARGAFQTHTYPSVRTVILSRTAYPLLLSCPNVQTIASTQILERNYAPWILRSSQRFSLVEDVRYFFHPQTTARATRLEDELSLHMGNFIPNCSVLTSECSQRSSIFFPWHIFIAFAS